MAEASRQLDRRKLGHLERIWTRPIPSASALAARPLVAAILTDRRDLDT